MRQLEPIVGRYFTVPIAGRDNRIFFEESGSGIPVLCLHTAGADARQYRHFQCDPQVLATFRVIAFDMPWHGKSLPPDYWWTQDYLLTVDLYIETVVSVIRALDLELPIVVGCSMGGSLVLELVRRHAGLVAGVVGFSAAARIEGRFSDWSLAPDINSCQAVPTWTAELMAPQSPEVSRKEVWWIYSQGGLGTYRGDTHFYSSLDLRGREGEIDSLRCPVYLFTGEYDFACSAKETLETAAKIPGAKGKLMPNIGHFPISENYSLCKTYLMPALVEIAARRKAIAGSFP